MSQFDSAFPAQGVPKRTSALAITSLVCSLVFCCPLGTIPGIVLGIAALASVGSDPLRRGRGMALTGIVLGVLFTAGQAVIYTQGCRMGIQWLDLFNNGPQETLAAGYTGDLEAFCDRFQPSAKAKLPRISIDDAGQFIGELRSRYGEFLASRPDESTQPALGQATATAPYTLEFEHGTVQAEVEVDFAEGRLGHIRIIDPERGDLTFPPTLEELQPAAPGPGDGT